MAGSTRKATGTSSKKSSTEKSETSTKVTLSPRLKDKRIKLSEDRLIASGDRGFSTVLATHGAQSDRWYYEVTVETDGNFRLGWSTRRTRFDFPIGSDIFSLGISDCGSKVIQGFRSSYASALKAGDVVGCYLEISDKKFPIITTEDPIWAGLYCDPENPPEPEISDSTSAYFSVNGEVLPPAFTRLVVGEFYPAMSIFGRAKLRANFGPEFRFPPNNFRAISDLFDPVALLKPPTRPQNFIPRGAGAEA